MNDIRDELRQAGDELRAKRVDFDEASQRVRELIVEALKAGTSQKDVIALSGYTRESVRLIARKAGIEGKR